MPLTARRHLKKMRGGAQAHLLEADDGNFYVVKFLNNPQHRRILVNEMLASVFLRYLQISCPEFAIIHLTDDFLRQYPEASIQLGSKTIAPAVGWHFGSRYPGHPDRLAVYDFVPDALLRDVSNLSEFLGTLVVDKWAANGDSRQAVFFRARLKGWQAVSSAHPLKMGFVAVMIDHGYLFNGPYWDFPDSPVQGLYYRKLVYDRVRSLDDFEPWLGQVTHFPEEVVDRAWRQIPPTWIEGEEDALESLLENLLRRRRKVPDLIRECRRAVHNPFPNWP